MLTLVLLQTLFGADKEVESRISWVIGFVAAAIVLHGYRAKLFEGVTESNVRISVLQELVDELEYAITMVEERIARIERRVAR